MTSKKHRQYIFGTEPAEMRERLLATTVSSDLPVLLGPFAHDKEVQRVFYNTWTLVHHWDSAVRHNRKAPAGTAELAIETLHCLRVEHKIKPNALAVLFNVPALRVYWYCSRWNYVHGTSKQYAYKERAE